jgi:cold shock CspA family protein
MSEGVVIYYNNETGFGVIQKIEGGGVFVHSDSVHESGFSTLYEGQTLIFEIVEDITGRKAINLRARQRVSLDD